MKVFVSKPTKESRCVKQANVL